MNQVLARIVASGAAAGAVWMAAQNGSAISGGRSIVVSGGALAILIIGWSAGTAWARAGFWAALILAGQACELQLIQAGILPHFQHYRLPAEAWADPFLRWCVVALFSQAVVVFAGVLFQSQIRSWLRAPHTAGAIVVALTGCGLLSAALSRDVRFFVCELALAFFIQVVSVANVTLFALALPTDALSGFEAWFVQWTKSSRPLRFPLLAALTTVLVCSALAWIVYQRHPHVADEVAYIAGADYYAKGQLVLPPRPHDVAFELDFMEQLPTQWFAAVPIGWPMMLAAGAAFHAAWLVNPVLAGINIVLMYLFLCEIYPRRTARIATALLAVSPWYVFLGMSFMTHQFTLTCALLAFLGVAKARGTSSWRWAFCAGLGVGVASLIRPLDGLIVGVLTAGWALGFGGKRLRMGALALLAAGAALTGSLMLVYNHAITGNALNSPYMDYSNRRFGPNSNAYGFGPGRGFGWPTDPYPGHSPLEAVMNSELNGASLTTELFGWSTGSLILIAVLLTSRKIRGADYLMLASVAVVLLLYAGYWFSGGPDFGPRYWFLIVIACVALAARGLETLEASAAKRNLNPALAPAAVALLMAMTIVNYIPWRSLDKYHDYLRMVPDVRELAVERHFGRSLVFIRGERFPDYSSAGIYNPVDFNADVPLYAWDRDAKVRAEVLDIYKDRPVWILDGPTRANNRYRIVAGPISRAQALAMPDRQP